MAGAPLFSSPAFDSNPRGGSWAATSCELIADLSLAGRAADPYGDALLAVIPTIVVFGGVVLPGVSVNGACWTSTVLLFPSAVACANAEDANAIEPAIRVTIALAASLLFINSNSTKNELRI
jgi:hypothetical protein